jgi:hypothetical protein
MFNRAVGFLVMLAFVPLAETRGSDPFTHAERRAAAPPVAYSPWHYWAPTLYRWKQHFEPATVPLYAADRYPGVPNPSGMVRYPNPAVSPEAYYQGTGLSYDPLRAPIVIREK